MPRRRLSSVGRRWRRRTDEEFRRAQESSRRRSERARYYASFRDRGPTGRFEQELVPLRIKVATILRPVERNIERVSDFELNELSGHELVLTFFNPQSEAVRGANIAMGQVVVDEAKNIAPQPGGDHPYSTGAYRESIRVQDASDRRISVIAEGGAPSWVTRQPRNYASFIERGGRTPSGHPTPARHTLEEAFHSTRNEQFEAATEYLRSLF